ncbi:MAG: twin-arginine translocase TatA/TatE family subunit [Actinomycetota bacterium]
MLNIGPQELILILIVALVVVGPQRLPELGRTIGRALREFRKIQDDVKDTIRFDLDDQHEPYVRPRKSPRTPPSEGKGDVTDSEIPAETDVQAPGTSLPAGVDQPVVDAPTETGLDPEPRAAE